MTAIYKNVTISPDHRVHMDLEVPQDIPVGEVQAVIYLRVPHQKRYDGDKAVEILRKIAQRGTLAKAIPDPAQWQREIRQDRALPGRDHAS
jgi:hypothetical protein